MLKNGLSMRFLKKNHPDFKGNQGEKLEATGGFEPPNQAFAEPCLTTWLSRLICNFRFCRP